MIDDHSSAAPLADPPLERDVVPRHALTHPWPETFQYAWQGVRYAWRTQRNFRVETGLGAAAVAACLVLAVNPAPVLVCAALVLSLELVNTAFEAVVDLATPVYHPLAKIAKDVAAGAVLVASVASVLVGAAVLAPPLWHWLLG